MEFELIRKSVEYIEEQTGVRGKTPIFSITTNGTLLDDEKTDFLVKHHFLILISLDGPKNIHDRYRVFADKHLRRGSFDVVMKNVERFMSRYPNYRERGLSLTFAPPFRWEETEEFLRPLMDSFPLTRVSFVNVESKWPQEQNRKNTEKWFEGTEKSFSSDAETARTGCPASSLCRLCDSRDGYRHISETDRRQIADRHSAFIECLSRDGELRAFKKMPLASLLFGATYRRLYERYVSSRPVNAIVFLPCLPGFHRRYCDSDGNYWVCENVPNTERFRMGDVKSGISVKKVDAMIHYRNRVTRCGECFAVGFCGQCFVTLPADEVGEEPFGAESKAYSIVSQRCEERRQRASDELRLFTEIMNHYPSVFKCSQSQMEKKPHEPKLYYLTKSRKSSPYVYNHFMIEKCQNIMINVKEYEDNITIIDEVEPVKPGIEPKSDCCDKCSQATKCVVESPFGKYIGTYEGYANSSIKRFM